MDLGYVYEPDYKLDQPTGFVPSYRKGARLSHAWIKILNVKLISTRLEPIDTSYLGDALKPYVHRKWEYSTLDLIPINSFVIFHSSSGSDFAKEVEGALNEQQIPVRRVQQGVDFDFADSLEEIEAGRRWVSAYGLDKGGVLVVRPDQFIAAVLSPDTFVEGIVGEIGRMTM